MSLASSFVCFFCNFCNQKLENNDANLDKSRHPKAAAASGRPKNNLYSFKFYIRFFGTTFTKSALKTHR